MPARAARDDAHILKFPELLFGDFHFIEEDFSGVLRDAAEQGVADGARLFKDFFLHEVLVPALFRHDGIPGHVVGGTLDRAAVVVHHAHALRGKNGDVAVREEKNLARMLEQGRDVTGNEILFLAETDYRGRAEACSHNFLWILGGEENQRVNAAQFLERAAHGFLQGHAALRILFHQVRHDFRVGFRDELVAFFLQFFFQLEVVFDDAVVHHDYLSGAVAVRMSIFFGGAAVSRPARMANSIGALNRGFGDDFFQVPELPGSAPNLQFAVLRHDGDTRGIVATVFELAQTFDDYRHNFLRADVADNSAHERDSPDCDFKSVTRPAFLPCEFRGGCRDCSVLAV